MNLCHPASTIELWQSAFTAILQSSAVFSFLVWDTLRLDVLERRVSLVLMKVCSVFNKSDIQLDNTEYM